MIFFSISYFSAISPPVAGAPREKNLFTLLFISVEVILRGGVERRHPLRVAMMTSVICFPPGCGRGAGGGVHVCVRLQRCRPMTAARGREMSAARRRERRAADVVIDFPPTPGALVALRPRLTHFPAPDNEVNGRRERLLNFNYTRTPNVHV